MAGSTPLAIGSKSDGAQVAGDAYGPVSSCSEPSWSALCSAHERAPSTADLMPCTISSTKVAGESVFAALVDLTGVVSVSWGYGV